MTMIVRVWTNGELRCEDEAELDRAEDHPGYAKHMALIAEVPGDHLVELEFPNEPPEDRFVRFGTDPRRMVQPIAVRLDDFERAVFGPRPTRR